MFKKPSYFVAGPNSSLRRSFSTSTLVVSPRLVSGLFTHTY